MACVTLSSEMSFTTPYSFSTRRDLHNVTIGTLGRTINDVEIKLVDEHGNEVTKPGQKGIALHRGKHVMRGYYKEPKKTKAVLSDDGWLNSGDLLMYTTSGELKFAGRAKDTIVLSGGENLEPEPIEFAMLQSSLIHQVIVVGQDQKFLGALVVVHKENLEKHIAESGEGGAADERYVLSLIKGEIKERVNAAAGFKPFERVIKIATIPKEFEIGDELTQTMKIRRNVVFDKYEKEIASLFG